MNSFPTAIFLFVLLLWVETILAQATSGFTPFRVEPDPWGNVIPDFSYVGYAHGEQPIPDVPVIIRLNPCTQAPALCREADDTLRIQVAINQIARMRLDANDIRGAVVLAKGKYYVQDSLYLNETGIVLRGEGMNETVIVATGKNPRNLIEVGTNDPNDARYNLFTPSLQGFTRYAILDDVVPVGTTKIKVNATANTFRAGDDIIITRPPNAAWITAIGMSNIPDRLDGGMSNNWPPRAFTWNMYRTILSVDPQNQILELDKPLYMSLDAQFGGGFVQKDTTSDRYQAVHNVGIENIRLESEYVKGKETSDEDHATTPIRIERAYDCWISHVTSLYFVQGYTVDYETERVTIQDSIVLDPVSLVTGGRRYSYCVLGSFVLVQRCFARKARHDYVTGARVQGPNVFFNSTSVMSFSDSGPHERWAFGILYDNIKTPQLNCQNRQSMGSGQGWSGAFHVYWNCEGTSRFQSPPFATNWVVGHVGSLINPSFIDPNNDLNQINATFVSKGRKVTPSSLYLWQYQQRLGLQATTFLTRQLKYQLWPQPIQTTTPGVFSAFRNGTTTTSNMRPVTWTTSQLIPPVILSPASNGPISKTMHAQKTTPLPTATTYKAAYSLNGVIKTWHRDFYSDLAVVTVVFALL